MGVDGKFILRPSPQNHVPNALKSPEPHSYLSSANCIRNQPHKLEPPTRKGPQDYALHDAGVAQ